MLKYTHKISIYFTLFSKKDTDDETLRHAPDLRVRVSFSLAFTCESSFFHCRQKGQSIS